MIRGQIHLSLSGEGLKFGSAFLVLFKVGGEQILNRLFLELLSFVEDPEADCNCVTTKSQSLRKCGHVKKQKEVAK